MNDPPRNRVHTDGLVVTVALIALLSFVIGFALGHAS